MRRLGKRISSVVLMIAMLLSSMSLDSFGVQAATVSKDYTTDLFGPNVYVFDENDSDSDVQAVIDEVYGT